MPETIRWFVWWSVQISTQCFHYIGQYHLFNQTWYWFWYRIIFNRSIFKVVSLWLVRNLRPRTAEMLPYSRSFFSSLTHRVYSFGLPVATIIFVKISWIRIFFYLRVLALLFFNFVIMQSLIDCIENEFLSSSTYVINLFVSTAAKEILSLLDEYQAYWNQNLLQIHERTFVLVLMAIRLISPFFFAFHWFDIDVNTFGTVYQREVLA